MSGFSWQKALLTLFLLTLAFLSRGCASRSEINQLRLGVWAAEHELWDEAIFRWQKALEKEPHSAYLYNNLAVAYEKKGLWDKAREAYEKALKLAPDHKYIKANYKAFQDHLKAWKQPEKKEEKKEDQERVKKKDETRDSPSASKRGSLE